MKKGISLAVLVVTIIVLVILTAATIATITGENGVIDEARLAISDAQKDKVKEKVNMELSAVRIRAAKEGKTLYEYLQVEENKNALKSMGFDNVVVENNEIEFVLNGIKIVTDNTGNLKTISETDNTPIEEITYAMISGANSEVSSKANATFRSEAPYEKFKGVKIDNALVDSSNYDVTSGSTIVTLHKEYILTLSEGTHTMEILSVDGSTKCDFNVNKLCTVTVRSVARNGNMTQVGSLEVAGHDIAKLKETAQEYVIVLEAAKGETVNLTTIARSLDAGTRFINWTDTKGNVLGANMSIAVEITGDTTIYANWDISGCFVAGTKIMMSDWTEKNIEDIVVGDKVISYNTDTKEYYTTTVSHIGEETVRLGYYEIELEDGTIVKPTSNHPLLTAEGFKAVSESIYFPALTTEDSLVTINGTYKIVRMEHIDAVEVKVYWIDVIDDDEDPDDDTKDTHIANGVIVHNGIYNMIEANEHIDFDAMGIAAPGPYPG